MLVHGSDGKSISAAFVCAYIMFSQHLSCDEAHAMVRTARSSVKFGIMRQLRAYHTANYDVSRISRRGAPWENRTVRARVAGAASARRADDVYGRPSRRRTDSGMNTTLGKRSALSETELLEGSDWNTDFDQDFWSPEIGEIDLSSFDWLMEDIDQADAVQDQAEQISGATSFAKHVCCPLGDDMTLVAASKGHLFCLNTGLGRYATHPEACTGAARGGHLNCLTRIHEFHAPATPWDEATTSACAERGDLPCLTFALDNGCPHATDFLVLLAARSGNLDMLRDLIDNRALYMNEDGSIFGAVFEAANHVCLTYLLDNSCPFSAYTFGGANTWPALYQVHSTIADVDARLLLCLTVALDRGWTITDGNFAGYMKFSRTLFPNCILYLMAEGLVDSDWTMSGF